MFALICANISRYKVSGKLCCHLLTSQGHWLVVSPLWHDHILHFLVSTLSSSSLFHLRMSWTQRSQSFIFQVCASSVLPSQSFYQTTAEVWKGLFYSNWGLITARVSSVAPKSRWMIWGSCGTVERQGLCSVHWCISTRKDLITM